MGYVEFLVHFYYENHLVTLVIKVSDFDHL